MGRTALSAGVSIALLASQALACDSSSGENLFRRGDFEGAAASFQAALTADSRCARAYWGLGRTELVQFHRKTARYLFARAYGLNPRDPDIILSYLEFVTEPESRSTLLRNVVLLTQRSDPRRAQEALGVLEFETRTRGVALGRLVSPYRAYAIPLSWFQPADPRPVGLLLPVVINKGKALRLLLDTGARGITIGSKVARSLDLSPIAEAGIGGLGSAGPVNATVTVAKSVAVGDLRLENCVVEVTRDALTEGADGVIGMNVFEAFRIRLNARNRTLELMPFADQTPAVEYVANPWMDYDRSAALAAASGAPAYRAGHFLLVRTKVYEREGLFLVDTGSAVTSLSRDFAPVSAQRDGTRSLRGAAGAVPDAIRISPVTLEIAGRTFVDRETVSMDLAEISQRQGVRISGILGYPAMSRAPVTFNYRDGLVDLGEPH